MLMLCGHATPKTYLVRHSVAGCYDLQS